MPKRKGTGNFSALSRLSVAVSREVRKSLKEEPVSFLYTYNAAGAFHRVELQIGAHLANQEILSRHLAVRGAASNFARELVRKIQDKRESQSEQ
jgi:hypothetical protein